MDVISEHGFLRCNCQEDEKKPKKRTIKDGRIVYGFECQNCGAFNQKSTKSFGLGFLPNEFADESIRARFLDRCRQHDQNRKDERSRQWWENYNRYLQTEHWKRKRQAVLERDKHICQGCLINIATQVHHLSYEHLGNELMWELQSVCIKCHRVLHPHLREQNIDWESFR
jgi:hypothetical protein